MIRVQTAGRYLKDDEGNLQVVTPTPYEKDDLRGLRAPAHKVILTDLKTGEVSVKFPGEQLYIRKPKNPKKKPEPTVDVEVEKPKKKKKNKKDS